jgi:hypothetical protein
MGPTRVAPCAAIVALSTACAVSTPRAPPPESPPTLPRVGFSVQIGAFADLANAAHLSERLRQHGLEAFHFTAEDRLHKVRFGSFATRELAEERGEALIRGGLVDSYYVVRPETGRSRGGDAGLRDRIVDSAMNLLGSPYRWGGAQESGVDCSGLTMTAYRLNGLELPRTSANQYTTGRSVRPDALREADLLFFAMEGGRRPSHVGLYIGEGRFIHAPGHGKVVRIDELSARYYQRRFLAARSYLQ